MISLRCGDYTGELTEAKCGMVVTGNVGVWGKCQSKDRVQLEEDWVQEMCCTTQ